MTLPKKIHRDVPWGGHPITLITDRYDGTYSNGAWIAFALGPNVVPMEPLADDITACGYWSGEEILDNDGSRMVLGKDDVRHPRFVGRGRTPDEAIADLKKRCGSKAGKAGRRKR